MFHEFSTIQSTSLCANSKEYVSSKGFGEFLFAFNVYLPMCVEHRLIDLSESLFKCLITLNSIGYKMAHAVALLLIFDYFPIFSLFIH